MQIYQLAVLHLSCCTKGSSRQTEKTTGEARQQQISINNKNSALIFKSLLLQVQVMGGKILTQGVFGKRGKQKFGISCCSQKIFLLWPLLRCHQVFPIHALTPAGCCSSGLWFILIWENTADTQTHYSIQLIMHKITFAGVSPLQWIYFYWLVRLEKEKEPWVDKYELPVLVHVMWT